MTSFCMFILMIIYNRYRKRKSLKFINYYFLFFCHYLLCRLSVLINIDSVIYKLNFFFHGYYLFNIHYKSVFFFFFIFFLCQNTENNFNSILHLIYNRNDREFRFLYNVLYYDSHFSVLAVKVYVPK